MKLLEIVFNYVLKKSIEPLADLQYTINSERIDPGYNHRCTYSYIFFVRIYMFYS